MIYNHLYCHVFKRLGATLVYPSVFYQLFLAALVAKFGEYFLKQTLNCIRLPLCL